jgi:hypothetical protein
MTMPWTELRIHGVSGTPPESMLSNPRVVLAPGGDGLTDFFRPADEHGHEQQRTPGRTLEAMHWGKHTAGSAKQALWLLIIPFGLVNAAQFMLPAPGTAAGRFWHAVAGAALRAIGIGLSLLFVLSPAIVAMDLVAWQHFQAGQAHPLPYLVAALVPFAMVLFFFSFGRGGSPDSGHDPALDADVDPADRWTVSRVGRSAIVTSAVSGLARRGFFAGDPDAPALRRLHVAAMLAMISALTLWPAAIADVEFADAALTTSGLLTLLVLVVLVFLGDPEESASELPADGGLQQARVVTWWHRQANSISKYAVGAAGAVIGQCIWVSWAWVSEANPPTLPAGTAMPGVAETAWLLLVWLVAAMVVLVIAAAALALLTRSRHVTEGSAQWAFRRYAKGCAAALIACVGAFLGVGFAAGFVTGSQLFLAHVVGWDAQITEILYRVSYAWGLTAILIGVLIVAVVLAKVLRGSSFRRAARTAFDGAEPTATEQPYSDTASAMFNARLKNLIEPAFWIFAVFGLLLSAAAGVEYCGPAVVLPQRSCEFSDLGWLLSGAPGGELSWLGIVGAVTVAVIAVALVILARLANSSAAWRRRVNVVWDVIAFWPRSVHPLVPPPYSQLVVADLRRRISWHLGTADPDGGPLPDPASERLVLGAHSQGSLISLAALLWLTDEERRRVGLLTHGSQIRLLYSRAFPAYVNLAVVETVFKELGGRWCNLYRDTDPLAGPVLSWSHHAVADPVPPTDDYRGMSGRLGGPAGRSRDELSLVTGCRRCGNDWRLLDPPVQLKGGGEPFLPPEPGTLLRKHSDYSLDPEWTKAVELVRQPPEPGDLRSAESRITADHDT